MTYQILKPGAKLHDGESVSIGVASPIEAKWEWNCLLSTLDHVDWIIRSRKISIKLTGTAFNVDTTRPADIQFLGAYRAQETIELLSSFDILYCAQKFSPNMQAVEEINLPLELPYFLASGRPIILHAPPYAAASKLLKPESACALSESHDQVNIELHNAIDRLIFDPEFVSKLTRNSVALLNKSSVLKEQFALTNKLLRPTEISK